MRRRTTFLVGGAVAVALALGGLVGGVLAESRSASAGIAPPLPVRSSSTRSRGTAGGVGTAGVSRASKQRFTPARVTPTFSSSSASRTSCAGGRQRTPRTSRAPRWRCDARCALRDRATRTRCSGSGRSRSSGTSFEGADLRPSCRAAAARLVSPVRCHRRRARRTRALRRRVRMRSSGWSRSVRASRRTPASRTPASSPATATRRRRGDATRARLPPRVSPSRRHGCTSNSRSSSSRSGKNRGRSSSRDCRAGRRFRAIRARRVELARVEAADGDASRRDRARLVARSMRFRRSQAVALLGDLLDRARATRPRRAVSGRPSQSSIGSSRPTVSRSISSRPSYRADNLIRPAETVELARRARADRPSIYGDDALALGARTGGPVRRGAASRESERSVSEHRIRSSTSTAATRRDVPGNRAAMRDWYARALALNPEFSVRWAPVARASSGHVDSGSGTYHPAREPHPGVARRLTGRRGGRADRHTDSPTG